MAELLTPDIVWEDPALPGPARGVAAVQEFMRGSWVGFPDLRFDETDSPHRTAEGDQVAWRWRMRGTMSGPLSRRGSRRRAARWRSRASTCGRCATGRIARYRAFYDLNDLARQLAIAPAPGSRAERAMVRLQRLQARMLRRARNERPTSTRSSSGRASRAARRRACSHSAARAWRSWRSRPDLDAYKTVCTHYIQPSATPTIGKLGLAALIEEHGAVRNSIDLWTPYGGWIRRAGTRRTATTSRARSSIRSCAASPPRRRASNCWLATRRPSCWAAATATAVPESSSRIATRAPRPARAPVVAADGRDTHVAQMAGGRGPGAPHNRFFYWAYWRGVEPAGDRSRMWFMEPDCAYTFPNENGLCLVLVAPHRDRLPEFRPGPRGRVHELHRRAARTRRASARHARVQAAGQARPAQHQPAGRAAGPGVRGRRRARLRSALGRRLRVGVPERGLAGAGDGRRARRRRRPRRGTRQLPQRPPPPARPAPLPDLRHRQRAARQPARARHVSQRGERRRRLAHVRGHLDPAGDRRRRCSRRATLARLAARPEATAATKGSSAAGAWRPCRPRARRSARGTPAPPARGRAGGPRSRRAPLRRPAACASSARRRRRRRGGR